MASSRVTAGGFEHGCGVVPPWLVQRVAEAQAAAGSASAAEPPDRAAGASPVVDEGFRARRAAATAEVPAAVAGMLPAGERVPGGAPAPAWLVHDADNDEVLPGRPARSPGQPATGDLAVDEAAEGIDATMRLFAEELGRSSYDDRGAPVSLTVHFGRAYNNAFWDGTQLVFGDGDGQIFGRFTSAVDVLAHEFGHAVTQFAAGLVYRDQSGALNEHVSDMFAACLKQWLAGEGPEEADWLVGEGLFVPGLQARALRDMERPGTAYDDPTLGRDPQVGHMDDYLETADDNGGVHLNSGIPNRAFVLASRAIGTPIWEGAGPIWYAALTSGEVGIHADFADFAAATVRAAGEHAEAVAEAWRGVGVEPGVDVGSPGGVEEPEEVPAAVVEVRRSGGFAGQRVTGRVDLESGADARAGEVSSLVRRTRGRELTGQQRSQDQPDRFVYAFVVDGSETVVPEQNMSEDLRRLAAVVLELDER